MTTTTTTTNTRKDFNFEAYNAVMKDANAGLKLFLVQQMMSEIATTAFRYRNPLAQQLMDTADEVESMRKEWKAVAEKSQKQTQAKTATKTPDAPVHDANNFEVAIF